MFYICGPLVLLKAPQKQVTRLSTQDRNHSPRPPGARVWGRPRTLGVRSGVPAVGLGPRQPHPGPTAVSGGSPRSFQLRAGRAPEPRVLRSEGRGAPARRAPGGGAPAPPAAARRGAAHGPAPQHHAPGPTRPPRPGPPPTRTFLPQKPGEGSRGRARGVRGVRRLLRPRPHFPSLLCRSLPSSLSSSLLPPGTRHAALGPSSPWPESHPAQLRDGATGC